MSATGQAALAQREGQAPGGGYYNDSGNNCTYGTGLLAHLGPCSDTELRRTVDAQQAQAEFQRRVDAAAARVRQQVQDRQLTQNQVDALASATFNTGRADNHRILDEPPTRTTTRRSPSTCGTPCSPTTTTPKGTRLGLRSAARAW